MVIVHALKERVGLDLLHPHSSYPVFLLTTKPVHNMSSVNTVHSSQVQSSSNVTMFTGCPRFVFFLMVVVMLVVGTIWIVIVKIGFPVRHFVIETTLPSPSREAPAHVSHATKKKKNVHRVGLRGALMKPVTQHKPVKSVHSESSINPRGASTLCVF